MEPKAKAYENTTTIQEEHLKKGAVIVVGHPRRIAQVMGQVPLTTVNIENGRQVPKTERGWRVQVGFCTDPIPGIVTPHDAKQTRKLLADWKVGAEKGGQEIEVTWEEVWTVRWVRAMESRYKHGLDEVVGTNAMGQQVPVTTTQVYVQDETRSSRRRRTSPIVNSLVNGVVVPAKDVPDGLFKEPEDERETPRDTDEPDVSGSDNTEAA